MGVATATEVRQTRSIILLPIQANSKHISPRQTNIQIYQISTVVQIIIHRQV